MRPEIFHITLNNSLPEMHATVHKQWGRHSWLSAFCGGASHRSDRTFSSGVKGCMLPVGGCLSILWVHTLTHTHTHSAPVMLGRFQSAASERSAMEFLRPKEISNWVMDMVTWTMRRQRGRESNRRKRGRRRERENEGMKHNMSSSPLPMTDLGFSVPKQTYLGIKKELWGVSQGQLN